MTDLLISAAKRLGIPTETSAGPGGSPPSLSIWARWPRHPQEIAQDVLNHIIQAETGVSLTPVGGTPLWRARSGEWTHIGRFEDAVAHLASHVAANRGVDRHSPASVHPSVSPAARGAAAAARPGSVR